MILNMEHERGIARRAWQDARNGIYRGRQLPNPVKLLYDKTYERLNPTAFRIYA